MGTSHILHASNLRHIPGLMHGFTTKASGDMTKQPKRQKVLLESFGYMPSEFRVTQVHGTYIYNVDTDQESQKTRADGIISSFSQGLVLEAYGADCMTLLIVDPAVRRVAAVHAGWRGVLSGIVTQAVAIFVELGSSEDDLRVAIGPHICSTCFEVDSDVAELFRKKFANPYIIQDAGRKSYIHLELCVRTQLGIAGICEGSIVSVAGCTKHEGDRFFSYRNEGTGCGHNMAFIGYEKA